MGRKKTPGLFKRGEFWHIDKQIYGRRLRESTGTESLEEAGKYLAKRIEEMRQATVYGVRPQRTFKQAATKFLLENQHKASIRSDAARLKILVKYVGHLPLDALHMGSLQPFIDARRKEGIKTRTINHGLQVVRRILNLAAGEWVDENGLTWLLHPLKIRLLPEHDLRQPYPLSWEEQDKLFQQLPPHLKNMALFAVNTGCRDQEICRLKWEWETILPEIRRSVFIIPKEYVKNRQDRLVVLNNVAQKVIENVRGQHPQYVFSYKNKPLTRMLNSGWKVARKKADLSQVRVHDLKHTFGRRLRAAGVSFEDRQDLLGHKSQRITTHYSTAELKNLLAAANSVCRSKTQQRGLTLLRCRQQLREANPHKIPTMQFEGNEKIAISA